MTVVQFVLLGLGAGALYSLSALGIVLIYRGSGIINLANGATGMVGTYCFWILHDQHGLSFVAAAVPSLALCGLLGCGIQFLVMKPLRKSSPLSRLLATLGVLALFQGAVAIKYHDQVYVVASSLPTTSVHIGSIQVGEDRLLILAIVLVLATLLALAYKFTLFGLATSAVAESPRIASHFGYSPNLIAAGNWALGSMLAGLSGILLAPITGLTTTSLTLIIVPALAAALTGSMTSFPATVIAGLVIGVAQSLLTRYVSSETWVGLNNAVPFVLVLGVLLFRGSALPSRAEFAMRLPRVGTGKIRVPSLIVAFAAGVVVLETVPISWVDALTITVVTGLILLSVVTVTGYAGQISLAQVALAGCGTLVAGKLVADSHLPFLLAVVIGAAAALPIGAIIGLPALRARGANLAIITLALSVALESLLFDNLSLTGGDSGIQIGFPSIFGLDIDATTQPRRYAIFVLIMFVICAVGIANLRRSRTGRRLLAVRANERAAASLGINVVGAKLYAFALSGMFAALGGILLSFRQPAVIFGSFQSFDSATYVANSVIGGVGTLVGPLFGGTLAVGGVGTRVVAIFGAGIQPYLTAVSGAILILILIGDPNGIATSMSERAEKVRLLVRRQWAGRTHKKPSVEAPTSRIAVLTARTPRAGRQNVAPATLTVESLTVRFGTTAAISNVSFSMRSGEVLGLIGPNGAGKTTLIDALTGFVTPTAGRIKWRGQDITDWSVRKRSDAGIGRTFQSLELFEDLTILENIQVASDSYSAMRYGADMFHPGKAPLSNVAAEAIDRFDLRSDLGRRPDVLPYGRRHLVAIARAFAAEPSVLLMDEAAAGLNLSERDELREVIRGLAMDVGIGVLFVEHDVDLVMRISDRVLALNFGAVVAEGRPDEVRLNPAVVSSYLGDISGAEPIEELAQ